jgi:hypothetical protein
VVLATLYCIPAFDEALAGGRGWLTLCAVAWLAFTPIEFLAGMLAPLV